MNSTAGGCPHRSRLSRGTLRRPAFAHSDASLWRSCSRTAARASSNSTAAAGLWQHVERATAGGAHLAAGKPVHSSCRGLRGTTTASAAAAGRGQPLNQKSSRRGSPHGAPPAGRVAAAGGSGGGGYATCIVRHDGLHCMPHGLLTRWQGGRAQKRLSGPCLSAPHRCGGGPLALDPVLLPAPDLLLSKLLPSASCPCRDAGGQPMVSWGLPKT